MMWCVNADGAGQRIRRRRQILGITQRELASALGVSPSTVANWETGKHFPRRYLAKAEEALGIDLSDNPEERRNGLPAMVRDNYGDEAVRIIWSREHISRDARLGLIAWYVALRDETKPNSV